MDILHLGSQMNKMAKVFAASLAGVLAVLVPSVALADNFDVSLKLDPGAAIPLVQPQTSGLGAGASYSAKLFLGAGPYLSFGPSASLTWLGSNPGRGSDQGVLGGGMSFMLRRPLNNDGRLMSPASPWLDTDFQLNKVSNMGDPIPSVAVSAGVSFPFDVDRTVWIGPFVRFENVFHVPGDSGFDAQENKIGIMGLSFEFRDPYQVPRESTATQTVKNDEPTPPPAPTVVASQTAKAAEAPFEINQKIQFAFDSADLQGDASLALDGIFQNIQEHANYSVTVRGYASSEGDLNYNKKLSLRRAQTVANYLTSRGVDQNHISAVGMGISNPVADNSTEAGRQLNRRVDFVTVVVTFTGNK